MPSTITFYTFVKNTPAYGQEMDTNFGHVARGDVLPISPTSQITTDFEHDLGQPLQSWLTTYSKEWHVNSTDQAAFFHASVTTAINFSMDFDTSGSASPGIGGYVYNQNTTGSFSLSVNPYNNPTAGTDWVVVPGTTLTISAPGGRPVEYRLHGTVYVNQVSVPTAGALGSVLLCLFENGQMPSLTSFRNFGYNISMYEFTAMLLNDAGGTVQLRAPINVCWTLDPNTTGTQEFDVRAVSAGQSSITSVTFEYLESFGRSLKNG